MASDRFTLAQLSDLHYAPGDAAKEAQLAAVEKAIAAAPPDVIVASGDISDDGFEDPPRFEAIRDRLLAMGDDVYIIPGNHDVGDAGDESTGAHNPAKEEYLGTWLGAIGPDRFCFQRGQWTFIGINSQIIGSGFEAEDAQLRWFDEQVTRAERDGGPVAVFSHQPPYLFEPDELYYDQSDYWPYPYHARDAWVQRFGHPQIRLIASGHLHWYHLAQRNGSPMRVWCPTTGTIVDDAKFPTGGDVNGFIKYHFDGDDVSAELVTLDLPRFVYPFRRPKVELPGREPMPIARLCLDFTGTLSRDGELLPGVVNRLERLARVTRVTVCTADTFGKAATALDGLPVEVERIKTGDDKLAWLKARGVDQSIVIGNGRNDVKWVKEAPVGIAVVGPEGAAGDLVRVADVVVSSITDALDLVLNPLRLKATLRD